MILNFVDFFIKQYSLIKYHIFHILSRLWSENWNLIRKAIRYQP